MSPRVCFAGGFRVHDERVDVGALAPARNRPPLRGSPASRDGPGSAPLRESRASRGFPPAHRCAGFLGPVFGVVLARGRRAMGGRAGPRRRRVGARPNHRRDRQTRRALLPRRRARGDGRGVRPAATATGGSGSGVSRAREGRQPDPTRRCADPRRERRERRKRRRRRRLGSTAAGAPLDADAVAAERLRRGGGRRLRARALVARWAGSSGTAGTAWATAHGWRRSASAPSRRSTGRPRR